MLHGITEGAGAQDGSPAMVTNPAPPNPRLVILVVLKELLQSVQIHAQPEGWTNLNAIKPIVIGRGVS